MKIGFDVQYKAQDAVYAALRLSDSLRMLGYEVTLFSNKIPKHKFKCHWDKLVKTPKDMSYDEWLLDITHIIWPVPPTKEVVQKVGKSIVTIALAPWDCIPSYSRQSLKMCAHVVSPSFENSEVVRKELGVRQVSTIEWDSSIPFTKKDQSTVGKHGADLLVPLHSSQILRSDFEHITSILYEVSRRCPSSNIMVSYTDSSMPYESIKALRDVKKDISSLTLLDDETSYISSIMLYGHADLVLWPAEIEGFGLLGIESIYMGTPVVAYNIPPMSNIITNGLNGVLVDCEHSGSKGGIMYAEPDKNSFIDSVCDVIDNKLEKLNRTTAAGRRYKRSNFLEKWKRLIEG